MTIVFRGHIDRVEVGHKGIDVHIVTEQHACGQTIVLHVSTEGAAHWLPGRTVSFTAYAIDSAPPIFPTMGEAG